MLPDIASLQIFQDAVDLGQSHLVNVNTRKLPDSSFALVEKTSSGEVVRKYPLTSPRLISHAIQQLAKVASQDPARVKVAAERITSELLSGNVGTAVAKTLEQRDLETLETLLNPGSLTSYSKGSISPDPSELGYVGFASAPQITLSEDTEGEPLSEAFVEGLDDATIHIHTLADAEKLSAWGTKHADTLSDYDKREIAVAVTDAYRAMGYAEPAIPTKVSALVRTYAGTEERQGVRAALLADRLQQLERVNCQVKISAAVQAGKDAYTALFSGALPVSELADNLSNLDKQLGVHTSLPAYATLFQPLGARDKDHDAIFSGEDNETFAHGDVRVKARDIKKLPLLNLKLLERFLGPTETEKLRQNPLGAFKALDDAQQLAVLRFVESRTQGAWRDTAVS